MFFALSYAMLTMRFTSLSISTAVASLKSRCWAISRPRKIASSFLPNAHAPFAHHVARDVGGTFDVVPSASGDVPEEHFFRGTTTHQHGQHAFEMLLGVGMFIVGRQLHG